MSTINEEETLNWVNEREQSHELGRMTILELIKELALVEEKIRELTDGDIVNEDRFYDIEYNVCGLADYGYRLRDELRKRIGTPYHERVDSNENLIDHVKEQVEGQQVAIDDLKDHEHSEATGKPVREIR